MSISINNPCHEDWEQMTPTEKGAFCSVCTKDVIDFSNKTIEEIKAYFSLPRKSKVCGRFNESQLTELSFDAFFEKFTSWKLSRKVAVLVATAFFSWFAGTTQVNAQNDRPIMGKVRAPETTVKHPETTPVKTTVKAAKDSVKAVTPIKNEHYIKGEIMVVPPKRKEEKK